MIILLAGLLVVVSFVLSITWIILKIVTLTMRTNNKITGEITQQYFNNNIIARIIAVCTLFLMGIACIIGVLFDYEATPEEVEGLLILGIIFFGFVIFRLVCLFMYKNKYRKGEKGYMIPVQMLLIMEHQEQEPVIIQPPEIKQELVYIADTIQQELDNKSNTSLLDSSLTSDSLINKPQTSNIFK